MSASVMMSWDDDGAPELEFNVSGSLVSLLRACLVDGYGDTPSLDWELVFLSDNEGTAVFRPKVGSRMFLYVRDDWIDGTNNPYFRRALVQAFESMNSVNNGIEFFPPNTTTFRAIEKFEDDPGSNKVKWHIIGDNQGFYWIPFPWGWRTDQYQHCSCASYWGSYIPIDITNQYYNFVISGSPYNTAAGGLCKSIDNQTYIKRDSRTLERGEKSRQLVARYDGDGVNAFGLNHPISPINGRYLYEPVHIWQGDYIDGWMPGLHNILTVDGQLNTTGIATSSMPPFFDNGTDKTMYVFVSRRHDAQPPNSYANRLSIVVGEGFRNAY